MKKQLIFVFFFSIYLLNAQNPVQTDYYQRLPVGSIKPIGWLKIQMQRDMKGFVGNLDKLVPVLINDPIYAEGRLKKNTKLKELGNLKSGDAAGNDQYQWWNSETQSNWWDGFIRNALLLDDKEALEKVKNYVNRILASQDKDGYLGIYDPELRYNFSAENGELWSKTTLYRGLLAYYEATNDQKVWNALVKAVDNVTANYPLSKSHPFYAGDGFTGGVGHGLNFTDVLDRMQQLTGDKKYGTYAAFLYHDFSENHASEKDAQYKNIMDPNYKLQSHGAHTYEHIRPLALAAYTSGDADLQKALGIFLERVKKVTTVTGGATGDEWISKEFADPTHTGYEYCSLHELMDSYNMLFQKSGNSAYVQEVENIFYNAAQGARHPTQSAIAYLKTDNSYEMMGTKNGEIEPDRKQTRYKYSPVHQDVAVCCSPNAGRITPYFLQNSWLKRDDSTLIAALLMPNKLETSLKNGHLTIENTTNYPYDNQFNFKITLDKPLVFTLKIKKPTWVTSLKTTEKYQIDGNFIVIRRLFKQNDKIKLRFDATVKIIEDAQKAHYFTYGTLVYALPIEAIEEKGRQYTEGFSDSQYTPKSKKHYTFIDNHKAAFKNGAIQVQLKNDETQKIETLTLVPMGKTILRQVSF